MFRLYILNRFFALKSAYNTIIFWSTYKKKVVKLIIKQLFRLNSMCPVFKRSKCIKLKAHNILECRNALHMLSCNSEHVSRWWLAWRTYWNNLNVFEMHTYFFLFKPTNRYNKKKPFFFLKRLQVIPFKRKWMWYEWKC